MTATRGAPSVWTSSTCRGRRAGFCATKEEAVRALQAELRKAGYSPHAIPSFREFQVMPTREITPPRILRRSHLSPSSGLLSITAQ
jgi:hypothetical protein